MEQSESIAALAAALSKAQGVMEGASKESKNDFFKSKYADLSSVWDACRKPLSDNGLSVAQLSTLIEEHPDMVCIETILLHSSGEWIKGRLAAKPVKADPQSIGSCITYLRRYSLQSMVGIAPEDDDGNAASGNDTPPKQKEYKMSKETKAPKESEKQPDKTLQPGTAIHKRIEAMINESHIDRNLFKKWLSSVNWIAEKDGALSLATLSEKNAKYICDKWDSAKITFNSWIKQNEGKSAIEVPPDRYECPEGGFVTKIVCDTCKKKDGCPAL